MLGCLSEECRTLPADEALGLGYAVLEKPAIYAQEGVVFATTYLGIQVCIHASPPVSIALPVILSGYVRGPV